MTAVISLNDRCKNCHKFRSDLTYDHNELGQEIPVPIMVIGQGYLYSCWILYLAFSISLKFENKG